MGGDTAVMDEKGSAQGFDQLSGPMAMLKGMARISYLGTGVIYSYEVFKSNFIHNIFILIFKSVSKKL